MGIHTFLIQADIEGIIEAGAPADEYDHEAAQITAAISLRSHEETILAIISLVWMKSFELSDEELQLHPVCKFSGAYDKIGLT